MGAPNLIKAAIFDFDGVIARTEPLHYRSFNETVGLLGLSVPKERWPTFMGRGAHFIMETIFQENRIDEDIEKWVTKRRYLFLKYALEKPLFAVRGLRQFLRRLHHQNIYTGIASGSRREVIVPILQRLKLRNEFSVIIGAEDFTHKKPDPEPFLKAAIGLRTNPVHCLAFEDSESGIQSALAAKMRTWCVATSPKSREVGLKYKVPIIKDYSEFPISTLGTD